MDSCGRLFSAWESLTGPGWQVTQTAGTTLQLAIEIPRKHQYNRGGNGSRNKNLSQNYRCGSARPDNRSTSQGSGVGSKKSAPPRTGARTIHTNAVASLPNLRESDEKSKNLSQNCRWNPVRPEKRGTSQGSGIGSKNLSQNCRRSPVRPAKRGTSQGSGIDSKSRASLDPRPPCPDRVYLRLPCRHGRRQQPRRFGPLPPPRRADAFGLRSANCGGPGDRDLNTRPETQRHDSDRRRSDGRTPAI